MDPMDAQQVRAPSAILRWSIGRFLLVVLFAGCGSSALPGTAPTDGSLGGDGAATAGVGGETNGGAGGASNGGHAGGAGAAGTVGGAGTGGMSGRGGAGAGGMAGAGGRGGGTGGPPGTGGSVTETCLPVGPQSCFLLPNCGDGVRNDCMAPSGLGFCPFVTRTEPCDGSDLGGQTCKSLGYNSGELACTTGCAFDTSGCAY